MAIFVLNPYILAVLAQRSLQSAGYDGGVVSTTSATYAARMSLATTEDAADYVAFWQSRIYHSAATSDTRAELFETSARQQVNIEVQNTLDRVSVGGAYYYAGGTSKTFQIRSSAEAGTASIADLSLQVLKLETNDTGNVNLTATSTLSTTFATLLTNTIPASGDYYVIGSCELLTDNADAEININGNSYGTLGDSMGQDATTYSPYFHLVRIKDGTPAAVFAGGQDNSAFVDEVGRLFTWGLNANGQLGDGTTVPKSSPVQIGTSSWSTVGMSGNNTAAIRLDGALFLWGTAATIGDGSNIQRSSPVQIGTSSWTAVRVNGVNAIAIRQDGYLFVWGSGNASGQVGDGTTIAKSSPVQIGTSSWSVVTVGGSYCAAIRSDGGLFTWGLNANGQLGDGTTIPKSSPVQVGTSSWLAVNAGANHIVAVRSDGGLFTWGINTDGQLGSGTTVSRSSPVQVGTSSWSIASAGAVFSSAIRSDGGLFAWGRNTTGAGGASGQLGDGTTVSKSSPVQIGTSSWASVDTGTRHAGAVAATGTLFTWGGITGAVNSGHIGDGTTQSRSSPTQIGSAAIPYNASGTTATLRYRSNDGTTMTIRGASLVSLKADKFPNTYYFQQPFQQSTTSTNFVTLANSAFTVANPGNYHLLIGSAMLTGTTVANRTVAELVEENSGLAYNLSHIREPNAVTEYYPTIIARVITFPNADINLAWKVRTTAAAHTASAKNMAAVLLDTGIPGSQTTFIGTTSATNSGTLTLPSNLQENDLVVLASYSDDTIPQTPRRYTLGQDGATAGTVGYAWSYKTVSPQEEKFSWTALSASSNNTVAIRSDGYLFTWGDNTEGQLGDGTTVSKSSPVQIGTSSWIAVSAGTLYAAAIRSDGALFTWGTGGGGALGDGTTINRSSLVQIGTSSWIAVNCGEFVTGAIRSDGALFTWGLNLNGGLGDGTTVNKSSPVQIGTSSWTNVSFGDTNGSTGPNGAAIRSDGALFTWGIGNAGGLGDGTTISKSSPIQIGTSSWTLVSVGFFNTFAIRSDGALFTWGLGTSGVLGVGTTLSRSSPVQVGTSSWTSVSAGYTHTAAIRSGGALFTWGGNQFAQLGDGLIVASKSSPVQIGTSSWIAVDAGRAHTGAVLANNQLLLWGYNFDGQLGIKTSGSEPGTGITSESNPTVVGIPFNEIIANQTNIVSGVTQATSAGHIAMAFRNIDTANPLFVTPPAITTGATLMPNPPAINVEPGSTVSRSSPVQVGSANTTLVALGFLDDDLSALECGPPQSFTLVNALDIGAAAAGGTLMAAYRDLETDATIDPTAFDGTGTDDWVGATFALKRSTISADWSDVSGSISYVSAIRSDGALFAWGNNTGGYIGDGTTVSKSSPVQIGTSSWTSLGAGTAAIRSDGRLFTWGFGELGRLGDGTTISKSSPVQIGTSSWTMVAGDYSKYAIRSDGALFTWGIADNGQLGDGTTVNKSSPVQIGTSSWSMVAAATDTTPVLAIRNDGALFVWGNNFYGQLGDGTTIDKSSPIQIGTSSWSYVSTSRFSSSAIRSDGALFTWGDNVFYTGRLGDGTTVSKSSPIQIGTSSWAAVACAESCSYAIRSDGALFAWGNNGAGIIGDGTTISKSSPIQIGTSSWQKISSLRNAAALGISNSKLYAWGINSNGVHGV